MPQLKPNVKNVLEQDEKEFEKAQASLPKSDGKNRRPANTHKRHAAKQVGQRILCRIKVENLKP